MNREIQPKPEPITRDIHFVRGGCMTIALGIPAHRVREIDRFVTERIDINASIAQIVTDLNARGDLTDAEWTAAIYSIGFFDGQRTTSR